jgi:hypothetical protein
VFCVELVSEEVVLLLGLGVLLEFVSMPEVARSFSERSWLALRGVSSGVSGRRMPPELESTLCDSGDGVVSGVENWFVSGVENCADSGVENDGVSGVENCVVMSDVGRWMGSGTSEMAGKLGGGNELRYGTSPSMLELGLPISKLGCRSNCVLSKSTERPRSMLDRLRPWCTSSFAFRLFREFSGDNALTKFGVSSVTTNWRAAPYGGGGVPSSISVIRGEVDGFDGSLLPRSMECVVVVWVVWVVCVVWVVWWVVCEAWWDGGVWGGVPENMPVSSTKMGSLRCTSGVRGWAGGAGVCAMAGGL